MEIYLIRNGESFYSAPNYYDYTKKIMNPPLTERGIIQAEKLAERLSKIKFDRIYSSDMERTIKTAEIINKRIHTEHIISEAFREINFGELYFKNVSDFQDLYQQWLFNKKDIPYPKVEDDVLIKCKTEIDNIIARKYTRVAIVCHGGIIRGIICGLMNIPQHKRCYFGHPPINCSISVIKCINNVFFLHTLNDYSHLEGNLSR